MLSLGGLFPMGGITISRSQVHMTLMPTLLWPLSPCIKQSD